MNYPQVASYTDGRACWSVNNSCVAQWSGCGRDCCVVVSSESSDSEGAEGVNGVANLASNPLTVAYNRQQAQSEGKRIQCAL